MAHLNPCSVAVHACPYALPGFVERHDSLEHAVCLRAQLPSFSAVAAGVDALWAWLRTGHLARPVLLLILVGAAGHFFGSQRSFGRVLLRNATYFRLTKNLVLARQTQFGVIAPFAPPSGLTSTSCFAREKPFASSTTVIFLPIANRLKAISAEEMELRMMTLEGILSIQAGDNPRLVSEKLMSYLPPAERTTGEEQNVARLDVEAKAA